MNKRPAHEPSRTFPHPQRLWDDPAKNARSLGCHSCLEKDRCGGVHTDAGILDCEDLCSCSDKSKCDMVCRFNPRLFVQRMREIGDLDFDNAPRTKPLGFPDIPTIVPLIDHRYARTSQLDEPVVAVSLYEIVNLASGKLHVQSQEDLAARFLIPAGARIVVSGVGRDPKIERWWELPNRAEILQAIRDDLGVEVVTSPNYSVLNDVPRTDNLYAMKRILLTWTEISGAGLKAALHVNARTERDYQRWAEAISNRPEIEILAFEFATGCGRGARIDWHVQRLCELADAVQRPLHLVIRGGGRIMAQLRDHFARVTLIETDAFVRTHRRRLAYRTEGGRLRWRKFPTAPGQSLDELLARNVAAVRADYEAHIEKRPVLAVPAKPSRRQFAANRNYEPRQTSFLSDFDVPSQAGGITPQPERVIVAPES